MKIPIEKKIEIFKRVLNGDTIYECGRRYDMYDQAVINIFRGVRELILEKCDVHPVPNWSRHAGEMRKHKDFWLKNVKKLEGMLCGGS